MRVGMVAAEDVHHGAYALQSILKDSEALLLRMDIGFYVRKILWALYYTPYHESMSSGLDKDYILTAFHMLRGSKRARRFRKPSGPWPL